jgi:hypothetical protein
MFDRERETLEALRQIERRLEQIAALLAQLLANKSPPAVYKRPVGLNFAVHPHCSSGP